MRDAPIRHRWTANPQTLQVTRAAPGLPPSRTVNTSLLSVQPARVPSTTTVVRKSLYAHLLTGYVGVLNTKTRHLRAG